jgi:hypothetical protein
LFLLFTKITNPVIGNWLKKDFSSKFRAHILERFIEALRTMTKLGIISTSVIFTSIACGMLSNANAQAPADKLTAANYQQELLAQSPFTSSDKDAPDSTISGTTRSGLRTFIYNESV